MNKTTVTRISRAIRHVVSRGTQGPRGGLWGDWSEIPGKPDFDALYDPHGAASAAQGAAAEDATAKVNAHASAPDPHPQYATDADLSGHTGNTSNPHSVTKAQVGLGNVDNTSDANKPVSTAQQNALNGKEPTITAGTTAQYWRGDKSWRDFATDVRGALLTGLSTASAAVVAATDSVLGAIGKLQAQITGHAGNTSNPHGTTAAQVGADPAGTAEGTMSSHVSSADPHTQYAMESALGDAAGKNTGTTAGTVAAGNDSRLSDAREWTAATVDQAEAEAGTATTRRAWTSQRVRQASNAAISAASSVTPKSSKIPLAGEDGKIDPAWIRQSANDIGTAGSQGFGVGICPAPPAGMSRLAGTLDVASASYGNYQYSDGSIMAWIPAFFYKWGTGANGLAINDVSIKPRHAFATVADANAAGYALHRAFYDGGVEKSGFFVDKYLWSNNGGIASSIAGANPISSAADHNPFSGLSGAPANAYYGAIAAAKTRGADFFCSSRFIFAALALLAYAHGRTSQSTTYCAWYHATNNFPKGCNNNALRDASDTEVLYTSTGHATYPTCGKTGSGVPFQKTTHNGQSCGVADLNGDLWEITPGVTSDGAAFFLLKTSVAMKSVTAGSTLTTDLWGAAGIAAMYDSLGATYESLLGSSTSKTFGSAGQVLSAEIAGNAWAAAGAGIPLAAGIGGSNAFGNDGLWDYRPNLLCPISGGYWSSSAGAGVWALALSAARTTSYYTVGGRSALYL